MKRDKTIYSVTIALLSLLILVYSTVLQFSIPSIVLCFGDGGHIAFEQTEDDNQCVDVRNHNDHLANNNKNSSHQDDDCEDTPLKNLLSTPFLEKYGKSKSAKLAVFDQIIKLIDNYSVSPISIYNISAIIHTSIKSLKSTILLI